MYSLASFYIQVNHDGKVLLGQNVDEERREAKARMVSRQNPGLKNQLLEEEEGIADFHL